MLVVLLVVCTLACGVESGSPEASSTADGDTLAVAGRGDTEVDRILRQRLADEAEMLRLADQPPINAKQERAVELIAEAREAVVRGDLERALAVLEEAKTTAPGYPVVYGELANVAYLRGDVDIATKALRHAIERDPDNPLWQKNLERLEAEPPRLHRAPP